MIFRGLTILGAFLLTVAVDRSHGMMQSRDVLSLRDAAEAHDLYIGTAVEADAIRNDPMYAEVLAREFNLLTTENSLKMGLVHPEPGTYRFEATDFLVAFAETHRMRVRGHTLIWHQQLPAWLENGEFSRDELLGVLHDHISTVVGRYKGRIYAWDVVNEAVDNDGNLRQNIFWRLIGPDYIDYAFQWAHEADPDALLFYNDNGGEGLGPKSDGIYKLVSSLAEKGIPIHGIGLQMHKGISDVPVMEDLKANMARLSFLGLQVQISEMDVRIDGEGTTNERLEQQANVYASVVELCLLHAACTAFVVWGFSDQNYERAGLSDAPLLFDAAYRPKPAYWAVLELLSTSSSK